MVKKIKRVKRRLKRAPKDCFFCKQKIEPDYKQVDILRRFFSDWGKIIGRKESGVCHKHQRILAISIKRARFLALLPYLVRPS